MTDQSTLRRMEGRGRGRGRGSLSTFLLWKGGGLFERGGGGLNRGFMLYQHFIIFRLFRLNSKPSPASFQFPEDYRLLVITFVKSIGQYPFCSYEFLSCCILLGPSANLSFYYLLNLLNDLKHERRPINLTAYDEDKVKESLHKAELNEKDYLCLHLIFWKLRKVQYPIKP